MPTRWELGRSLICTSEVYIIAPLVHSNHTNLLGWPLSASLSSQHLAEGSVMWMGPCPDPLQQESAHCPMAVGLTSEWLTAAPRTS